MYDSQWVQSCLIQLGNTRKHKPLDLTVAWKELEDLPEILSAADLDKWQG